MQPMKRTLVLLVIAAAPTPLFAGETGWQEIMSDVKIRMISGDIVSSDNTAWAALEIDMPQGVKTYWRVPGESGIPTMIDFSGSRGIGETRMAWPMPKREKAEGYLDHAYYGDVVLPIELDVTEVTVALKADVTLGVCSDICVPVNIAFDHSFDFAAPDRANALRIEQALATVPLSHDGEDLFGTAMIEGRTGQLSVELRSSIDPAEIIAEIDGSMALFDVPTLSADGKWLEFGFLGRAADLDIGEGRVRLSFPTSDGPLEVMRPLVRR